METKKEMIQSIFADNNISVRDVVKKSAQIEGEKDYGITYPTVLKIINGKKVTLSTMTRFIRAFNAILVSQGKEMVSSSIFIVE